MDTDFVARPPADAAPAEPPDAAAGVPAPPPIATVVDAAPPEEAAGPAVGGAPPRRALKLVVSLRPRDAMGYRALVALGTDGCDPLLRAADVADLAAALEEVPGLLAEAEERWQRQPRYPTATPAKTGPAAPSRASTSPKERPRHEAPATPAAQRPAATSSQPPASASSPADQLALFGLLPISKVA